MRMKTYINNCVIKHLIRECDSTFLELFINKLKNFKELTEYYFCVPLNIYDLTYETDNRDKVNLLLSLIDKFKSQNYSPEFDDEKKCMTNFCSEFLSDNEYFGCIVKNSELYFDFDEYKNISYLAISGFDINSNVLLKFYRELVLKFNIDNEKLKQISDILFPDIYIHWDENKIKIEHLGKKNLSIVEWIFKCFAFLNDNKKINYSENTFINTVKARWGLDLSPESYKTRKNHTAMNERKIKIIDKINNAKIVEITCEWHFKYSPTSGRIYFNFNNTGDIFVNNIKNKPIVGIFSKHLST